LLLLVGAVLLVDEQHIVLFDWLFAVVGAVGAGRTGWGAVPQLALLLHSSHEGSVEVESFFVDFGACIVAELALDGVDFRLPDFLEALATQVVHAADHLKWVL
jgi:hypothetical protein